MDATKAVRVEFETLIVKSIKANFDRSRFTITLEGHMPLDVEGLAQVGPKIRRLSFLQVGEAPVSVAIKERQTIMPGFAPVMDDEGIPKNEESGAVITWDAANPPTPEEIDRAVAIAIEEDRRKPDPIHTEIIKELKAQQEGYNET